MELADQKSETTQLAAEPHKTSIHPTVIITGDVQIAENVIIAPHCVLTGPLRIAAGCQIGTGCLVGGAPEHRELGPRGVLTIGTNTILREYCIVHHGTTLQSTKIGSNCYIMNRVYIGHDCQIANDVTISAGATLGGHVIVSRGANLGMQVAVHQRSTIGAFAMIGMSTPVCKDIPPLCSVAGNPIHLLGVNHHAIGRLMLETDCVRAEESELLYANNNELLNSMLSDFEQSSTRPRLVELRYADSLVPRKPR